MLHQRTSLVFAILCVFFSLTGAAQNPNVDWAYGLGASQNDIGKDVITDAAGNVYITGSFNGTFDFDPGTGSFPMTSSVGPSGFLMKLDAAGNFVWAFQLGDQGNALTFDGSGNLLVTGDYSEAGDFDPGTGIQTLTPGGGRDIFVAKYTPDGDWIWSRGIGGTLNDSSHAIVSNDANEVFITGLFRGTVDFDDGTGTTLLASNGSDDIFILKLDDNGDFEWAGAIGGPSIDEVNGIAINSSDEIFIVGAFRGTNIDFDPEGTSHLISSTDPSIRDVYVLKLSTNGNFIWVHTLTSAFNNEGLAVAVDDGDNVYIGGEFRGTIDFNTGPGIDQFSVGTEGNAFVTKWDSDGGFLWTHVPSTEHCTVRSLDVDAGHHVYLAGETYADDSGQVIYISELDNLGTQLWENYNEYQFVDGGNEAHAIDFSADGNIYVTGEFMEKIEFGFDCTFELNTSTFARDIFIQKITYVSNVTITSFTPTTGTVGSTFDITGTGFSTDPSENEVRVNGVPATVNYATATSIQAVVPDASTGPVDVTVNCHYAISALDFNVININILVQPVSDFTCEGTTVHFDLVASGTSNITYQWQFFNGAEWDNLNDGAGISGTTSPTLSLNTTGESGSTDFRCKIEGDFVDEKYTREVTLVINPAPCTPPASAPSLEWAKNMTAVGDNIGSSIATDAAGNVYTTGRFEGTVDFDPGPGTYNVTSNGGADAFVSKFDANGNLVWAKNFGGSDFEHGYSIAVNTSGDILFTGLFYLTADFDPGPATFNLVSGGEMDMFVAKLSTNGDLIWAKSVGADGLEEGVSLATDPSGNIYITGHFGSVVDFDPGAGSFTISSSTGDPGDYDAFILKLNTNGNFIWAKAIGNSGLDQGRAIAVDASGNSYTTGQFDTFIDMDPGSGDYGLSSVGGFSAFLLKLDANGDFVWARNFGGNGSQNYGYDVEIDASSQIYVTGSFEGEGDFDPGSNGVYLASTGETDIYIVKFNNNGDFIWGKGFGGPDFEEPISIDSDNFGNVLLLLNYFYGTIEVDPDTPGTTFTSSGDQDFALLKFDPNGEFVWGSQFGGTNYDFGFGLVVDLNNNIYTTGFFQESTDFNPNLVCTLTLDANTGGTIFVQKFSASAVPCPSISSQPDPQTVCAGASATFNVVASGPNLNYQWQKFDGSIFQNISDGSGYAGVTTADLAVNTSGNFGAGNYRCIVTAGNANPLTSGNATLTIGSGITAPTVTGTSSCTSGSFILSAMGATNGQYRWYTVATGGTAISGAVNDSYTTPTLSATTSYFVAIDNGSCESSRTQVDATILSAPSAPTAIGGAGCGSGSVTISASGGSNGQYRWYTTLSGGTAIPSEVNATFATPAISSTTSYFVSIDNGSCEGPRSEVVASITSPPSAPATTGSAVCNQGSLTLSAAGGATGQYRWYTTASGGAAIPGETNSTYATPVLTTTTTYFVSINNGCESPRSPVIATLNPLPTKPVITSIVPIVSNTVEVCNGTATLLAPDGFAQYTWSTGATTQQITVAEGNFSVTVTNSDGCVSASSDVVQVDCLNDSPVIEQVPLTTDVNSEITLNLLPLLSDPDDNLNIASLTIVTQPTSGAIATIDANGVLRVDYSGVTFSGTDQLTIRVCDLENFCTDQILSIDVVGEVVVYDAFSPNGDELNSFFFLQNIDILEETKSNHVYIYNRWGDVVFDIKDYNNTTRVFRGFSNNGTELTSGTYFYKIEYGNGKMKTGYLTMKK